MARTSAGLLLYRRVPEGLQAFLVPPGGPFWQRKDLGAWSIPKGEVEPGEDELAAAIREFAEETGISVTGEFSPLGDLRQAGGKRVVAWAVRGDADPAAIRSSTFELEWPPRSGRRERFPEVDRAAWFDLATARLKILKSQQPFLDRLAALTAAREGGGGSV